MSLIEIEGFESRTPRGNWTYALTSTAGRFGGYAQSGSGASAPYFALPSPVTDIIVGWAWRPTASFNTHLELFSGVVGSSTPSPLRLTYNADRRLQILRNNDVLAISDNPVGPSLTWVYMEIKARIADVGGYMEVRVNGQVVLSFVGDTAHYAGSNGTITRLGWYNPNDAHVDDIYIADNTGSEFNDYIGEIQVEGLVPNGNGSFSQLVGSDGNSVDNYLLVDEVPAVETDLVQSDVVGARDTYQFTNIAMAAGQILAVQPSIAISKANAGPAAARTIERLSNGVERESDPFFASSLMSYSPPPQTRDPEGAVWTVASVNNSEFGVEVA